MPVVWVAVLTVLLVVLVPVGLWAIGRRARGRAAGGAVAGPFEEIWHPAAHRARIQIQVQDQRIARDLLPGDPPSASG